MPNRSIFCNSPWYELHIYWDGSLGFCCQASHKMYDDSKLHEFNIKNMSISEWYNSQPMKEARLLMFNNAANTFCSMCYHEEKVSGTSRRHRSNIKSAIFVKENFVDSYSQSPGFEKFEHSRTNNGNYQDLPIDLHIDLGNYCNLACKMCWAGASSKIAAQEVKWGINESKKFTLSDWTRDEAVWNRFLKEVSQLSKLKNVHFMGGETLISPRFEEFVDYMIEHEKFDLNFSFVTNGTIFNENLIKKLLQFQRVGIEVSIETLTDHNAYIRQGTDNRQVLENINRYADYCNNSAITLTLRPAVSLLSIGNYDTLLRYALKYNYIVKTLFVTDPEFLNVVNLPDGVKKTYIEKFNNLKNELGLESTSQPMSASKTFNESNPIHIKNIINSQIDACLNMLSMPEPNDIDHQLHQLVKHCQKWDRVYDYNARDLYSELTDIFDKYEY